MAMHRHVWPDMALMCVEKLLLPVVDVGDVLHCYWGSSTHGAHLGVKSPFFQTVWHQQRSKWEYDTTFLGLISYC